MRGCVQEVRLQEAQPSRSYLPSWISKPLQRSRQPSYDSEISTSALPTPNLDNTIHGSLHGANNFGDKRWQSTGQPQPARRAPTPPSLRVLGSSDRWLGREVRLSPRPSAAHIRLSHSVDVECEGPLRYNILSMCSYQMPSEVPLKALMSGFRRLLKPELHAGAASA